MFIEASHPSTSPETSYASNVLIALYPDAWEYTFIISSVFGRIPSSHSDAYTAFALLCQKIAPAGAYVETKSRMATASGSENALTPALTTLLFQVLSGFHLQSKFRFMYTSCALKRPVPFT